MCKVQFKCTKKLFKVFFLYDVQVHKNAITDRKII